jgi:hypothetical protein
MRTTFLCLQGYEETFIRLRSKLQKYIAKWQNIVLPPLLNHPQLNRHHLQKFDPGVRFYSPLALFLSAAFTLIVVMVSTFGRKASVEPASPVKHSVLLAMGILTP